MLSLILIATTAQAELTLTFDGGSIPANGEVRTFLVSLDRNTESIPICAIDVSLQFDDQVVNIIGVNAADGSSAWGEPAWSTSQGLLRIAHAGSIPIIMPSHLFNIMIVASVNPDESSTGVEFSSILLNDGSFSTNGDGGTISVTGTPIYVRGVTISPDLMDVLEGQTVSFDVVVDTNGDPAVDWSFGEGFQIGQILPTGVYVAPTELAESREIVIRATSRIFPEAYAEASVTVLPVVGDPRPELWVTTNPANRRFVEIYASVGNNPNAVVQIQVGGETLETTAIGSPVFAYRATYLGGPSLESISISAEIDEVLVSRTITF